MHGFESLVSEILAAQGHWVRTNFKVELTKEEKRRIGRPSAPRWELDILAYSAPSNLVQVVECKSYLDSPGVNLRHLNGEVSSTSYKLFREPELRDVVFSRLARQLAEEGLCQSRPEIRLALAAGRVKGDPSALSAYFEDNGWILYSPEWIRDQLTRMADAKYENSIAAMVAKLLLR